jgi:hypothetical protein
MKDQFMQLKGDKFHLILFHFEKIILSYLQTRSGGETKKLMEAKKLLPVANL